MNIDTTIEIRQLQKIHAMAGIGYWVYNHNTNEMWWSDVTYELLGYSDKNINPNKENLTKHIHPEDLQFFEDALKIAKNEIDLEFRFYRNGELRLGKINGEILNDNGIVREEVLFQDITEIKIKEFEIAKAWNKALEAGMAAANVPYSGEYDFVETEYHYPITHMVAPKEKTLACDTCHAKDGRLANLAGFYMPGRDSSGTLDFIGWFAVIAALIGVFAHGILRVISKPKEQ